jgi:hypothetical protein
MEAICEYVWDTDGNLSFMIFHAGWAPARMPTNTEKSVSYFHHFEKPGAQYFSFTTQQIYIKQIVFELMEFEYRQTPCIWSGAFSFYTTSYTLNYWHCY